MQNFTRAEMTPSGLACAALRAKTLISVSAGMGNFSLFTSDNLLASGAERNMKGLATLHNGDKTELPTRKLCGVVVKG